MPARWRSARHADPRSGPAVLLAVPARVVGARFEPERAPGGAAAECQRQVERELPATPVDHARVPQVERERPGAQRAVLAGATVGAKPPARRVPDEEQPAADVEADP